MNNFAGKVFIYKITLLKQLAKLSVLVIPVGIKEWRHLSLENTFTLPWIWVLRYKNCFFRYCRNHKNRTDLFKNHYCCFSISTAVNHSPLFFLRAIISRAFPVPGNPSVSFSLFLSDTCAQQNVAEIHVLFVSPQKISTNALRLLTGVCLLGGGWYCFLNSQKSGR